MFIPGDAVASGEVICSKHDLRREALLTIIVTELDLNVLVLVVKKRSISWIQSTVTVAIRNFFKTFDAAPFKVTSAGEADRLCLSTTKKMPHIIETDNSLPLLDHSPNFRNPCRHTGFDDVRFEI